MVHDTVAQKNFDPVLPPLPENIDEDFDEESVKIVRLVKNKEPLVCDTFPPTPCRCTRPSPTQKTGKRPPPSPEVFGVSDGSFITAATSPRGTTVYRVPLFCGCIRPHSTVAELLCAVNNLRSCPGPP